MTERKKVNVYTRKRRGSRTQRRYGGEGTPTRASIPGIGKRALRSAKTSLRNTAKSAVDITESLGSAASKTARDLSKTARSVAILPVLPLVTSLKLQETGNPNVARLLNKRLNKTLRLVHL